jgi:uncharacterized protein YyaL (SSP411 family)
MMETLVNWREWGEEAFSEAREQDKLILLDISAVWCHWCHVMDQTSYSDPAVSDMLNSRFVPVRVDTDRMPDVNERYNMGGWPTTAVLTPGGEVLIGATYVPPDKLKDTLANLDHFYQHNREEIHKRVEELKQKKAAELKEIHDGPKGELSDNIRTYVLEELDRNFDPVHGGFGSEPKFPVPDAVDLLLTAYKDTGRGAYLDMAGKTLDGMASYGMYDHVHGGFFRYSVTRDWAVPHFEKMLEVNAGLVVNYINAWRVTGASRHIETVKKTLKYVQEWLWAGDGGGGYFCGSQDADEEYYKLPLEERDKRTPPFVDRTMFTNLNAKMSYAFLAAWEATRVGQYKDHALQALKFVLDNMRGEGGGLYHFHDGEPRRFGLLTDQSAMVRTLLFAYQLTGEREWLDEALKLVRFVEKTHWDTENGAFFDLPSNPTALAALADRAKPLPDNAEMAQSLKILSVITGEERYAEMARACLTPFARAYREYSYLASTYALAVDYLVRPPVELNLAGDMGSQEMAALAEAAGAAFVPRRVLRLWDNLRDKEEIAGRGYAGDGRAAAYVCRDFVCTARIESPEALVRELNKGAPPSPS